YISFSLGTDMKEAESILENIGDIQNRQEEYISYTPIFSSKSLTKEKVHKNDLIDTVIYPRLEEMAKLIKSAVSNVFNLSLISNFILVGGGAKIKGINKVFSNIFETKFSFPDLPEEKFSDYQLTNLFGMVEHFSFKIREEYKRNKYPALRAIGNTTSKNAIQKVWEFFKNYFF
ncbi:MAG: cell division protein FtsA, partial [bacterium]